MKHHLVTAIFDNKEAAERAYAALQERGFTRDEIHLIMSEDTRKKHFGHEVIKTEFGNQAMAGAGTGSAIGGTVGAVAAALAAIGSNLLIPGLGLVVAGPIAAALAGAGAGGIAGGLVGALIGSGIPRERAIIYEKGVNEGHIVLGVDTRSSEEAAEVERELLAHNGHNVHR